MKIFILLLGALTAAQAAFAQSATFTPDDRTLMGFMENQQYAKAADYLKMVVASDPENKHYLSLLAYMYYMSNQLPQAEASYARIFSRDSSSAVACNYLGKINLLKGNKKQALYFFCRLVDLEPGVAAYYKQLASLWVQLNNGNAATWNYHLSYEINPNDPDVIVGLANGWLEQKMFRQADSILDRALQQDSLQEDVLVARIHSAYVQEKYDTIFPLIDKLKQMDAVSLQPFFYAAAGYFLTKRYQQCVDLCDFMISRNLKTRSILYIEAMAFEKLKKYDLSLAMLDECIGDALSDDAIRYFTTKGDIYEKLKKYNAAMKQYDTAYYIFKAPMALYKKALVYDRNLEKPSTALRYYKAYLQGRRDTVPPQELPVVKYVRKRVKALNEWKAATR